MLEHFAGVISRQRLPNSHLLWRFEDGDTPRLQEVTKTRHVGLRFVGGDDDGAGPLTGAGIAGLVLTSSLWFFTSSSAPRPIF